MRREQNRGNGDGEPNVRRSRRSKVVRFNNNIFDADADCAAALVVVSKRLRVRQRFQSRSTRRRTRRRKSFVLRRYRSRPLPRSSRGYLLDRVRVHEEEFRHRG